MTDLQPGKRRAKNLAAQTRRTFQKLDEMWAWGCAEGYRSFRKTAPPREGAALQTSLSAKSQGGRHAVIPPGRPSCRLSASKLPQVPVFLDDSGTVTAPSQGIRPSLLRALCSDKQCFSIKQRLETSAMFKLPSQSCLRCTPARGGSPCVPHASQGIL